MRVTAAEENYLGKNGRKRLNCAHSVAEAFKDKFPITDAERSSFDRCGGGMAPGGFCGALLAARLLAGKSFSGALPVLDGQFAGQGGSLQCREIRAARKMNCVECVRTASMFLDKL